ncbi:YcgN family cysteine cluster protein [Maritalea sp.]|uniref:YcgN family cysteine cluster protein n=1 Tax=Maritalea sp. TaxID=2003361 RepID=UPI003EF1B7CF
MNFWETKSLDEMNEAEWESLCDGCARCCLVKLEDEDTGQIVTSDVHCSLMNEETCGCSDYKNRQTLVPDCIKLTPKNVGEIEWMPVTCAYRRLQEGKGLAWWHPLVSGDKQTVIDAGISVKGRSISEEKVQESDWEDHIVGWPEFDPSEEPK